MNNSKAVKILCQLSIDERKAFGKFLRSPFFNTNTTLIALYQLLEHTILEKGRVLTEEKARRKLSPDGKISLNLLRKLKTALLDQLVSFLAHTRLQQERPSLKWRLALAEMNRLEALSDFPKYYRQAQKAPQQNQFENADALEDKYHIEIQHGQYQSRLGIRRRGTFLNDLNEHLDQAYLFNKLRLACLSLNQRKIIQHTATHSENDAYLDLIDTREQPLPPLAYVYFLLRKCLANSNTTEEYNALKQMVQAHHTSVPEEELTDILTMVLNHCARKVNGGAQEFREETFQWYEWMLENGFLSDQGEILPQHAKNIVTLAAKIGKKEWIADFLKVYGFKIKAADRQQQAAYITYLDASAAFQFHDHQRAARLMEPILKDLVDIFFAIDARTILLRSHYENGNADGIENLCESFRIFLSRNSLISEAHKVHFGAFIKYFRRFLQIPLMDSQRLKKLHADLGEDRNVACHDWLMEKVNGLLGKIPGSFDHT